MVRPIAPPRGNAHVGDLLNQRDSEDPKLTDQPEATKDSLNRESLLPHYTIDGVDHGVVSDFTISKNRDHFSLTMPALPPGEYTLDPPRLSEADGTCETISIRSIVRKSIQLGSKVRVQARPSYIGLVTWMGDHPGGKATVQPLPDQGVTPRKRTVWKDKLEVITGDE